MGPGGGGGRSSGLLLYQVVGNGEQGSNAVAMAVARWVATVKGMRFPAAIPIRIWQLDSLDLNPMLTVIVSSPVRSKEVKPQFLEGTN